jgi:hypothetical protein
MSAIHDVRNPEDIEHAVTTFAQTANGGLIVTASGSAAVHRKLITATTARPRRRGDRVA